MTGFTDFSDFLNGFAANVTSVFIIDFDGVNLNTAEFATALESPAFPANAPTKYLGSTATPPT